MIVKNITVYEIKIILKGFDGYKFHKIPILI